MQYSNEQVQYIALSTIEGLGDASLAKLMDKMGSLSNIFDSSMSDFKDLGIRVSKSIFDQLKSSSIIDNAKLLIDKCSNKGVKILAKTSSDYPYRLVGLRDSPSILYSKGNFNFNEDKVISIVGTRNATSYGKKVVNDIIAELSKYNPLIVSGLASGIDSIAHKSALENGLKTTAVFAGGIDNIYPYENVGLAKQIAENGGLITEYPVGTQVETFQFVARNRIIAGMADATIVIEAPTKSGALITAHMANIYERDVFSVPGNISERNSQGCLELIKNHKAQIFTSVKDFLESMNWASRKKIKSNQLQLSAEHNLSEFEKKIYDILVSSKECMEFDDLVLHANSSQEEVSKTLLGLEMYGIVGSLPGKKFYIL